MNLPAPDDNPRSGTDCPFAPTRWTLVLEARGDSPAARAALAELCESYYQPVFRFLKREGRSDDDARELAQGFFARLLAGNSLGSVDPTRGRFRSYLLGALRHFLGDQRDRDRAAKRGGESLHEPLPGPHDTADGTATAIPPAIPAVNPDHAWFDRQWALAVVDRALTRLAREHAEAGRSDQFERLKPWLVGPAAAPPNLAEHLGWSEGALRIAVHRLRKRFRELAREEVAQTVPAFSDVHAELRYLVDVLSA